MPIHAQILELFRALKKYGRRHWNIGSQHQLDSVLTHTEPHFGVVVPKRSFLSEREQPPLQELVSVCRKAGFLLEDNLADTGLRMDHTAKFVTYFREYDTFYRNIEGRFSGDFMVLPVRFDMEGLAPFEARDRILKAGNVPLDPIAVVSFLYTHRDILDDAILWLDALAVQVSPRGDGLYEDTCYVDRRGKALCNMDWNWGHRERTFRIAPYIVTSALPQVRLQT